MKATWTTYVLHHRPVLGIRAEAMCWIGVHRHAHGVVVVMTEPPDNPGMSVTNAAEQVATAVAESEGFENPAGVLWLEHYLPRHPVGMERDTFFDETYDLVRFEWGKGLQGKLIARSPTWQHIDDNVAYALIVGNAWIDPDDSTATPFWLHDPVSLSVETAGRFSAPARENLTGGLPAGCIHGHDPARCPMCRAEYEDEIAAGAAAYVGAPGDEDPVAEDDWLEAEYEDRYGYPESTFEEQYENAYVEGYPFGGDDCYEAECAETTEAYLCLAANLADGLPEEWRSCACCGASIPPDEVEKPCVECGAALCFYCAISGPRCLDCEALEDDEDDDEEDVLEIREAPAPYTVEPESPPWDCERDALTWEAMQAEEDLGGEAGLGDDPDDWPLPIVISWPVWLLRG